MYPAKLFKVRATAPTDSTSRTLRKKKETQIFTAVKFFMPGKI